MEAFSSIRNLRTRHAVVTRDPLNMEINMVTMVMKTTMGSKVTTVEKVTILSLSQGS
jgi:hypothetical protein